MSGTNEAAQGAGNASRTRYAIVGLGGRHELFRDGILKEFAHTSELVGLCDLNVGRVELSRAAAAEGGVEVPGYAASDFERMIRETRPDCVIVTVKDCHHHEYICRAMELGCDVLTEKPMTTDAAKCSQILAMQRATGRRCTVTFNYRYAPPRTQVKDLLMSGAIGEVLSVDFHWLLDTTHGADYFRRWHRNRANSGGLLVHKATHHFDLVNWWLDTVPETVYAEGMRQFYTPETGDRLGLTTRAMRCHGCPEAERCTFCLDLSAKDKLRQLYLDCERYDGYYRDQCVFSDDIDIEDSMQVLAAYRNGARLCYSLNAFAAWEGYIVTFNGTQGRLEHKCEETVYVSGDGSVPGALKKEGTWIRLYPHGKPAVEVEPWPAEGGHGGADPLMLRYLFDPDNQSADAYARAADHRAGAWSILTGIAANESIREGRRVAVDMLVEGIGAQIDL